MASTEFKVEVLTPDGEAFSGDVVQLSTRTTIGSLGVLARHEPVLAMLDPTELRLYKSDNDVIRYAQGEGYLQVAASGTLVLVDELREIDDLDASDLRERLKKAQDTLGQAEEGSEEGRQAAREERRYEAFLKIAEG